MSIGDVDSDGNGPFTIRGHAAEYRGGTVDEGEVLSVIRVSNILHIDPTT